MIKTTPKEKKCKKAKQLSEMALQIVEYPSTHRVPSAKSRLPLRPVFPLAVERRGEGFEARIAGVMVLRARGAPTMPGEPRLGVEGARIPWRKPRSRPGHGEP